MHLFTLEEGSDDCSVCFVLIGPIHKRYQGNAISSAPAKVTAAWA